jgi:hypothetical protein
MDCRVKPGNDENPVVRFINTSFTIVALPPSFIRARKKIFGDYQP